MKISKKILTIRQKLNLTQIEFADALEITERTLRKYESEEASISSDKIAKLIELYHINPMWLFLNKGEIFLTNDELKPDIEIIKEKHNLSDEDFKILSSILESCDTKQEAIMKLIEYISYFVK